MLLFLIVLRVLRGLRVDGRVFTVKCSEYLSGLRVATAPAGTASLCDSRGASQCQSGVEALGVRSGGKISLG